MRTATKFASRRNFSVCSFKVTVDLHSYDFTKSEDENAQNYNSICCFVWMWNLISRPKGRTKFEGISEHIAAQRK